jgi:hypothetical protein
MDKKNFESIVAPYATSEKTQRVSHIIEGFERYASDGTPFHSGIYRKTDFDEITKLFGVDSIKSEDVIDYHLHDMVSDSEITPDEGSKKQLFSGEVPTEHLFQYLADTQSIWSDNPNDYRATLLVKLDETTVIALGQECSDESEGDDFIFEFKHWIGVLNADDIDNYQSWKHWELTFFDTKKYEEERDRAELERETAEGVVNLSRLTEGQRLRLVEQRPQHPPLSTSPYSHYSKEELEQRRALDLVIIESGSQPICEMIVETSDTNSLRTTVKIIGGGNWTTRKQNPVQSQEKAITPSYGYISKQQHLLYVDQETGDMMLSDNVIHSIDGF